jgi:predicted outer membrane protein
MESKRLSAGAAVAARPGGRLRPLAGAIAAVLVAGALGLAGVVGAGPAQAHDITCKHDENTPRKTNNEPLSDSDKDLLTKVRWAGLWEQPAGAMAAQKGVNPRVREIGTMISTQHCQLDTLVTKAAAAVGFRLPDEPNPDQKHWLAELQAASGPQFDQVFVDRLRVAHGKVFPAIANVRATTRNSAVRELATLANGFVLTHLTLLESTGLVDYAKLPAAAAPPAAKTVATASVLATTGTLTSPLWLVWIVGAFAALFGLRFVGYWLDGRREKERRRQQRWRESPPPPTPRSLPRPGVSAEAYRSHHIPRHATHAGPSARYAPRA